MTARATFRTGRYGRGRICAGGAGGLTAADLRTSGRHYSAPSGSAEAMLPIARMPSAALETWVTWLIWARSDTPSTGSAPGEPPIGRMATRPVAAPIACCGRLDTPAIRPVNGSVAPVSAAPDGVNAPI